MFIVTYLFLLFLRYNIVERYIPDAFKNLLDDIHKLETELGLLPQKWKVLWDKLEIPVTAESLKVKIIIRKAFYSIQNYYFLFRDTLHLVHNWSDITGGCCTNDPQLKFLCVVKQVTQQLQIRIRIHLIHIHIALKNITLLLLPTVIFVLVFFGDL